MLNPSTADGNVDDPTVRRCISYAKRFGCDSLEIINLFSFRATNPADLLKHDEADLCGPDHWHWVEAAISKAYLIICGWGANAERYSDQVALTDQALRQNRTRPSFVCHLGFTKKSHPKHPLYLRADAKLIQYPWEK
jgi:hypothetical protein